MVCERLSVLTKSLLLHVPPRISILVNLLIKVNRPHHTNNFVVPVETVTAKLCGFGDTSDGNDRGRVSKSLLDGRCEKGEFCCRDKLVLEMVFDPLTEILQLPSSISSTRDWRPSSRRRLRMTNQYPAWGAFAVKVKRLETKKGARPFESLSCDYTRLAATRSLPQTQMKTYIAMVAYRLFIHQH